MSELAVHQRLRDGISALQDPQVEAQRRTLEERRRDADRPFMLFVVGVGKAGKSSLINALAGRKIAPESVLPLTWKIDAYQAADSSSATLCWTDGTQTEHSIEEAEALCGAEEQTAFEADQRGELYKGKITEARWRVSGTQLPPNIQIVDTPGLHQIRSNLRGDPDAKAYRPLVGASDDLLGLADVYFHRADAVLWLFDATALDGVSANAARTMRVFDRDQYAVINKTDLVSGVTEHEMIEYARGRVGDDFTEFFAVSARAALKSSERGGLPAFRRFIETTFLQNARLRKLNATGRLVNAALEAARRVAEAESARLMQISADFTAVCRGLKESLRSSSAYRKRRLVKQIEEAFERAAAQVDEYAINRLAGIANDEARNEAFRRMLPLADCDRTLERELRDLIDTLNADAGAGFGRLRVQEGRYDFGGNQAAGVELLFPRRSLGLHGFSSDGLQLSLGDLNASDGEAVFFGGLAAIAGAMILGPIGLVGYAIGWLFGKSKGDKVRAAIFKASEAVGRAADQRLTQAAEQHLNRILEHADAQFVEAIGLSPAKAAKRSDALLELALLLESMVSTENLGSWQSALARGLAA